MKFRTKIGGSMRARAPVIRHRSVDSFTTETSSGVSPQGLADDESSSTASLIRSNTLGHTRKYIQRSRSEERDDLTHQVSDAKGGGEINLYMGLHLMFVLRPGHGERTTEGTPATGGSGGGEWLWTSKQFSPKRGCRGGGAVLAKRQCAGRRPRWIRVLGDIA